MLHTAWEMTITVLSKNTFEYVNVQNPAKCVQFMILLSKKSASNINNSMESEIDSIWLLKI